MQQTELIEIGILQQEAVENYRLYGVVSPIAKDIKIAECRAYNLKLKAEQEGKREYWKGVNEARIHNLKLLAIAQQQKQDQREIQLLEIVRKSKDVLSSVR